MNAGQLAALIAAGVFAVLACVAIFVLIKLSRLMSAATGMVTQYRDRADQQAQAAVDRTNEQLIRTDAITASMDQVTTNMAELSGHVSALAGLARGISMAASAPMTGMSAFVFGLRRAILVRRSLEAAVRDTEPGSSSVPAPRQQPAITGTVTGSPSSARSRIGGRT
jgi:hypothetical protein